MRLIFLLLLGSMLVSNTLSPQYLIWLAPFVPFLTGFESGMFIFISCLTWFYFRYWGDILTLQPVAVSLLASRNILLITLFIVSMVVLLRKLK